MMDEQAGPSELPSNVRKLHDKAWKYDKASYSPDTIYGQSRDDKGHSSWLRVRMQPHDYDAIVGLLSAETPYPYKTVSEFVRDACIHRMVQLSKRYDHWTAEFDEYLEDHNFVERLGRTRRYREWIKQMVAEVDSIADDYASRNQVSDAIDQLLKIRDDLGSRDAPHRDYIHRYITNKLGELRKLL